MRTLRSVFSAFLKRRFICFFMCSLFSGGRWAMKSGVFLNCSEASIMVIRLSVFEFFSL